MKSIRNAVVWLLLFAIWSLWESALRISAYHPQWSRVQSFVFIENNLLFATAVALLIAVLAALLVRVSNSLKIRRLDALLVPAWAPAAATLLAIPLLLYYHRAVYESKLSVGMRWLTALLLFAFLFFVFRFLLVAIFTRMKPRRSIFLIAILFLIALPPFVVLIRQPVYSNEVQPGSKVKGIVLISVDTLRRDYVSAYGSKAAQTPNIDRVASDGGILFLDAVSSIPITGPSHATMFTGLPPLIHGVHTNGAALSQNIRSFVAILRDRGFNTAGFVSGFPMKATASGLDQGFETYDDKMAFMDSYNEMLLGRLIEILPFFDTGIYRPARDVTHRALRWLDRNSGQPFFLFVHYYDPHFPYGKKESLKKNVHALDIAASPHDLPEQKRLYAQEIERVDEQIGRIAALLKGHGVYQSTMLIVTADHGESLGEHNYYYDHTQYLYEPLIRIPLLLRCPALVNKTRTATEQVGLIDLKSAILAAAGIDPPANSPLLKTDATRRTLYSERYGESTFDRFALRTTEWKLIRTDSSPPVFELYHISKDPEELHNVILEEPALASSLREMLDSHIRSLKKESPQNRSLSPEEIERLKSLGYVQ